MANVGEPRHVNFCGQIQISQLSRWSLQQGPMTARMFTVAAAICVQQTAIIDYARHLLWIFLYSPLVLATRPSLIAAYNRSLLLL
jgi:hypothetical protein